jgi:uncharacterized protein YxeA
MKKIIIGVVALVLVAGSALFLGRHHVVDFMEGMQQAQMSSSLVDGLAGADSEAEAGAEVERLPQYAGPTSAYIEEGADNRDVELSFGQDGDREPTGIRSLTNRHIQQVMHQNQRELLGCYGAELAEYPDLAGEVEFEFAVYPAGNVAMVRVKESSLRSHEAEDCFVEHARHWNFPATDQDGLARFTTSINFQF